MEAIEYAVTAGEGTLLAYGVAAHVDVTEDGVTVWPIDWPDFEDYANATIIARPCRGDCETGS
jgi:hypothetical protein